MTGRVSAAAERALRLILSGVHPADAARLTGVHLATVYRAMKRSGIKNGTKDKEAEMNDDGDFDYAGNWVTMPSGVTYDPRSMIIVCPNCHQRIDMYTAEFRDNVIVHTCVKS